MGDAQMKEDIKGFILATYPPVKGKPLQGWWKWRAQGWSDDVANGLSVAKIAEREQLHHTTVRDNLIRYWNQTGAE